MPTRSDIAAAMNSARPNAHVTPDASLAELRGWLRWANNGWLDPESDDITDVDSWWTAIGEQLGVGGSHDWAAAGLTLEGFTRTTKRESSEKLLREVVVDVLSEAGAPTLTVVRDNVTREQALRFLMNFFRNNFSSSKKGEDKLWAEWCLNTALPGPYKLVRDPHGKRETGEDILLQAGEDVFDPFHTGDWTPVETYFDKVSDD